MRWNKREKAERPDYPKLVPLAGSLEDGQELLPLIRESDPEAVLVEGGARGVFVRVHSEAAEAAAKRLGESRSFPLA